VGFLAATGHQVLSRDDPTEPGVWVVDQAAPGPLSAALAGPGVFGLVMLADDPRLWARLPLANLIGWALLPVDADATNLDLAVRGAEAGLVVLGHPRGVNMTSGRSCKQPFRLTAREQQVLQLVAEGRPNKAIARALNVSENTVKFHVGSICARLDARSRTEAVTVAARNGLLML
jgi:DNA-binding CsgD family transcriptional regulator